MEKDGVWSEDFKITAFMVDKDREANLTTVQNICQEVAGNHAQFRQLGYEDMHAQGMAWVLNRLKINIIRFPKWMEMVNAKTWVSQMQPFSHRHFQIKTNDTEGAVLANIYTIWIPIDTTTKRPKRLPNFDFPLNNIVYDCEIPEKLPFTEGGILSTEQVVHLSDLDMLGHVNNAKYIEWLLDDFYKMDKTNKPKSLEINYLGEVFEGETVQIYTQKMEDTVFYSMKNKEDNKELIRAKINVA